MKLNGAKLMQEGGLVEGADPVGEGARGVKLIEGSAISDEGDADSGVSECMNENCLANVTEFSLFGAKKFTACGNVIEEVIYFDLSSDGAADFCTSDDFPTFDANERAFELISGAGCEGEMRDGGDCSEGFAAKA